MGDHRRRYAHAHILKNYNKIMIRCKKVYNAHYNVKISARHRMNDECFWCYWKHQYESDFKWCKKWYIMMHLMIPKALNLYSMTCGHLEIEGRKVDLEIANSRIPKPETNLEYFKATKKQKETLTLIWAGTTCVRQCKLETDIYIFKK